MPDETPGPLEHSHDPADVAARIASGPKPRYVADAVYGAIDGTVTTFAVAAGALGADLPARIVIILGAANLFADGFSMAAGNFVATRADKEMAQKLRAQEERHIDVNPAGERVELREIYRAKGFTGGALDVLTRLISSRREVWVDTMLAEEYGLTAVARSPLRAAAATFGAFIAAGSLPLAPFVLDLPRPEAWAIAATGVAFFAIGSLKSYWSLRSWWQSGLETFAIGMGAALVAYLVGAAVDRLVG